MFYFDRLCPESFALIAALLGVLLDTVTNVDERNAMGNFLVSIGQTMLTSAAQSVNRESFTKKQDMMGKINDMCTQLESMKKELCNK